MRERRQIVGMWREGRARVLVTIVRVEGSSYRQPGARLLLGHSGEYAGTISGGCLEAEITRKAVWKIHDGAMVERYSTTFEDSSEIPFGLGCGGVVTLLLEPVDTPECEAVLAAIERSLAGQRSTLVTWLPGEGKTLRRVVLDEKGNAVFASAGLSAEKLACACGLHPDTVYEGRFVEEMLGPQRLFVLGAGEDARPLVAMAAMLGWNVTVADGRSHLARPERFPEAQSVKVTEKDDLSALGIHAADAVVVMTHSYEQDRALLTSLLPLSPRYLGLLGAKQRSSLLIKEAAERSGLSLKECCQRIWAPIGLDLGGEGPEAIALAVMAEAQAVCMGKRGASRHLTVEDVMCHLNEDRGAQSLQSRCAS